MGKEQEILSAKQVENQSAEILGYHMTGGVVEHDDALYFVGAPGKRFNGNGFGYEDGGYKRSHLSEVGVPLEPLPREVSSELAHAHLEQLRNGELPTTWTTGVEVEGTLYDHHGNLISKHDSVESALKDPHPELLRFTCETTTDKVDGHYPQTMVEIAQTLAQAVTEGTDIARSRDGIVVYSSGPEMGAFEDATFTPHPYLEQFAPQVRAHALKHWDSIPPETLELYERYMPHMKTYFQTVNTLNWPWNALHVQSGMPLVDELADPRIMQVAALTKKTMFAKLLSFGMASQRHLYDIYTGYPDTRAIGRRLLATTHDSEIPQTTEEFMIDAMKELTEGSIHSISRYPQSGQHAEWRVRMEKGFQTVESIDAPMTPDVRRVLGWVSSQQLLNVLALEALEQTGGNETQVIEYLEHTYGPLMRTIPTRHGPDASYTHDLRFARQRYQPYLQQLEMASALVNDISDQYPGVAPAGKLVKHHISSQIAEPLPGTTLTEFFGIEAGSFNPNGLNRGVLTDYKPDDPTTEMLLIQAEASRLQAEALTHIRDEQDLRDFIT